MQNLSSLRKNFLDRGYAVLEDAIQPRVVAELRSEVLAAVKDRPVMLKDMPPLEAILRNRSESSNNTVASQLNLQLKKRNLIRQYFGQMRRNKREIKRIAQKYTKVKDLTSLSADEMWQLNAQLAEEVRCVNNTKHCTKTVKNDPQMLDAINRYHANVWMTSLPLKEVLLSNTMLRSLLAELAVCVGGVEKPVIFGDIPLLRKAFGDPIAYHFSAPTIGTRTNHYQVSNAVTLVLFTFTPTSTKLPLFVMENSHRYVVEQYIHDIPASYFLTYFSPSKIHVSSMLKQFHFNADVVGKRIDDIEKIRAGSVMVLDPHLLVGFGPNLSCEDEVVYELNIVSKEAVPYLEAPSWISAWRSFPQDINFDSPGVFPSLQEG